MSFLRMKPGEVTITEVSSASAVQIGDVLEFELAEAGEEPAVTMLASDAAQNGMGMVEPGSDRAEVIAPIVEWGGGEDDAELVHLVKSNSPSTLGSIGWLKMTSRVRRCSARQVQTRRSSIQRVPG